MEQVYLSCDEEFSWPNLSLPFVSDTRNLFGNKGSNCNFENGDVVPCCLDAEGIIKLGNLV